MDQRQKAREESSKEDITDGLKCSRETRGKTQEGAADLARRLLLSSRSPRGMGEEEGTHRADVTGATSGAMGAARANHSGEKRGRQGTGRPARGDKRHGLIQSAGQTSESDRKEAAACLSQKDGIR